MEEQELKNIWKISSHPEYIQLDMIQLLKDFKIGMENRERIVRRRDLREVIGAIIGILSFIHGLYFYSYPVSRIGCLLGILTLLYIIYKLYNNRKSKFSKNLFLSIQDQLKLQKQFMLNQARLLDTFLYWGAIPLFVATSLFLWGVSKSEIPLTIIEQLSLNWKFKLILTLVLGLFYGYIGWMNKRAAIINWTPLIKQIEDIQQSQNKE